MAETSPTVSVSPVIPEPVRNPLNQELIDRMEGKIPTPAPIEIYCGHYIVGDGKPDGVTSGYRIEGRWNHRNGKQYFIMKTMLGGKVGYQTNMVVGYKWDPAHMYYIPDEHTVKAFYQLYRLPVVPAKEPTDYLNAYMFTMIVLYVIIISKLFFDCLKVDYN